MPDTDRDAYGVYYFRKDIDLASVPAEFKFHVSADQRYKLYVNGVLASLGPARNDSKHWNYETLDIAGYLREGKNVVAAQVWSEGPYKPVPNATIQTGFILMGEGQAKVLSTDGSWRCIQDPGYTPLRQRVPGYYALGAGEQIDMSRTIADWQDPANTLSDWKPAHPYALGAPHDDASGTGVYMGHPLVASTLPQVERYECRLQSVRRNGGLKLPKAWPAQPASVGSSCPRPGRHSQPLSLSLPIRRSIFCSTSRSLPTGTSILVSRKERQQQSPFSMPRHYICLQSLTILVLSPPKVIATTSRAR